MVHVAYEDAEAYAAWAGLALPTEAQWEHAARGGLDGTAFTWGDEPETPPQRRANYWHGDFPWRAEEGYGATAPVGSFPENGYGLADMAGNVWEWTQDWYVERRWTGVSPCCLPREPAWRAPGRELRPAHNRRSRSPGRSSRAAPSSAPTPTAYATGRPRDDRTWSIPA